MTTTVIPNGDGQQLHDLLVDDQPRTLVLEVGTGPFDYQMPRTVVRSGTPKRIVGNGAHIWCTDPDGWLRYEGDEHGAGKRMLRIDDLDVRTSGAVAFHAVNMNFCSTRFLTLAAREVGYLAENAGPDGWSERNRHDSMTITQTPQSVVFRKGTGRPSFHGHYFTDLVSSEAEHPFTVEKGANLYASHIHGRSWISDADLDSAGICVWGLIHGTTFDWVIENPCGYGIFIDARPKSYRQHQARVKIHFVHPVNHGGLMWMPAAGALLPEYRFTYGAKDAPLLSEWVAM